MRFASDTTKNYERLTVDDGNGIERRLEDVLESTEGIREQIRLENVKRDRRIRLSRILILLVLVVAVVAVFVAAFSVNSLNNYKHDTQRARVASCKQFNRQQNAQANAETVEIRAVVFAVVAGDRSAETQHRVEQFYLKYDRLIAASHPLRDCSADGIARYLGQTARQT